MKNKLHPEIIANYEVYKFYKTTLATTKVTKEAFIKFQTACNKHNISPIVAIAKILN